ncbi:MAG: HU family DNA-binding protein [Rhodobacteraceae bacterium]|nr:HU family DNA-binding protein [Paracoccaceae bacterium]MCF8516184.1 HU family DNA-binding protein [Paracoccaceae bacterium]MCF8520456.1 HU family DNA-binding protein [Paracoccaceae bacterium]
MATTATRNTGPKGIPAPKPKAASRPAQTALSPAVDPAPETASAEVVAHPAVKLRDLVERVVETTGGKKKGVKEIVEATLTQLGAALAKGEELNLPGVGKVRVARSVDRDGRAMMTLKVRGAAAPKKKDPQEALAEAGEDV